MLVPGADEIAKPWGISEAVIGLTLVAVGISLPELTVSVMAALTQPLSRWVFGSDSCLGICEL